MSRGMVSQIMGSGPAESPIPADGPAIEQEGASAIIRKSGYVGKTVAGSARSIRETGRRRKIFPKNDGARCRSERPIGSRQFCCTAAAGATPWHRKTDCLDKSFCGHRQRLCYRFLTWNNSSSKLYARIRDTGGHGREWAGKSVAPCVTPVWNKQSGQRVASHRWREGLVLRSPRSRRGRAFPRSGFSPSRR